MKKQKRAIFISAGILLLIGVLSAISLTGGTPVIASFKYNPNSGYRYSGTGSMNIEIDMDKLKLVTGYQEGKMGDELAEVLRNKTSSLDMDMVLEGSSKDSEEISDFKIVKQSIIMLESKNYINGDQRWVSTAANGSSEGNWQKIGQSDAIGDVWSSLNLEDIAKLKDYFVLKSRDDNYTTFLLNVMSENISMLFDSYGQKSFESLSSGNDFAEFVKSMDMSAEITVPGNKNTILPADKISLIKLNFKLPFDSLNKESVNAENRQFEAEEKKIFDSFYIDVNFTINFFYDNVSIDKPVI